MAVDKKQYAADPDALERAIKCHYSHRPDDVEEAKQFIERAILAGKVNANTNPVDILNILLLGARESEYLAVRVRSPSNSCAIPNESSPPVPAKVSPAH